MCLHEASCILICSYVEACYKNTFYIPHQTNKSTKYIFYIAVFVRKLANIFRTEVTREVLMIVILTCTLLHSAVFARAM